MGIFIGFSVLFLVALKKYLYVMFFFFNVVILIFFLEILVLDICFLVDWNFYFLLCGGLFMVYCMMSSEEMGLLMLFCYLFFVIVFCFVFT